MLAHARIVGFGQCGKLHAVIHAFHAQRIGSCERADRAMRLGGLESIGQVEFALGVV